MKDSSQEGRGERRVAVRFPSQQDAPCHYATLEKLECRWGKVHDVSRRGLCLELDCALAPEQTVIIELPSKSLQEVKSVPARVIHVLDKKDGTWQVGLSLARPLSDEEFQGLQ